MEELIIGIDTEIFLWLNSRHTSFWDTFMFLTSGKLIWVPLYLSMLYAIFLCYGWRTMLLMGLMTAVAVGAADQLCSELLRPVIERMRPANLDNPLSRYVHIVDDYRGGRFGFPSSHAANTFALAALTAFLFRRWQYTLFVFTWAVIICYSRIYLGVHYPGDILAGLTIGSAFGAICYACAGVVLAVFVYRKPREREARALIARYKHGAPLITTRIGRHEIKWRPTYLPVTVGAVTFICILVYTAFAA